MNNIWRALEYFKYLLRCIHLHGIHSPFVFQLNRDIFQEKLPYYCFDEIESLRAKLMLTDKIIEVEDYGAGSKKNNAKHRKVSNIARTALKDAKRAQLLFRMVQKYRPDTILELGTSFGLTSAYLAKACSHSKVISIEGSEQIAEIAHINFKKLHISNIELIIGNIDNVLKSRLMNVDQLDFVFFDGNHQKKSTLEYFELCLSKANADSIFVFDDIYWSRGMKQAWSTIKEDARVIISIDLFHMGIVFFKTDQAKEHFTVYH